MKTALVLCTAAALLFPMQDALCDGPPISVRIEVPAYLGPPPDMVWVPDLRVYVAVGSPYPIFFLDSYYYHWYRGYWYRGPGYNGPWMRIRVPPPGIRALRERDWPVYRREAEGHHGNPHYRQFRAGPDAGGARERGSRERGHGFREHGRGGEEHGRSGER